VNGALPYRSAACNALPGGVLGYTTTAEETMIRIRDWI
jgi:hypothetical protein